MINELTQEQIDLFPVYVDRWVKIGNNPEPISFDRAKAALRQAIELSNTIVGSDECITIPEDNDVMYAQSPMGAYEMAKTIVPEIMVSDLTNNVMWGQHDADWAAFNSYYQEVLGVTGIEIFEGNKNLCIESGWVFYFEDKNARGKWIICDRPVLKYDAEGRLHCEDGLAIEYPDGWGVAMWHGTRVPREWILEPGSITAAEALKLENAEQARCACEIIGWVNVLKELDSVVIDRDEDPQVGTLVEVNLPTPGTNETTKERFVVVECGTGRTFALWTHPKSRTAIEGVAWTYGVEPEDYNLDFRT